MGIWGRLRRKFGLGGLVVGGIIIAALAFIGASALFDLSPERVDTANGSRFPCTVLSVYDGDGPINCAERDQSGQQVKVRLRGIEAREIDNSCSRPDICPKATGAEGKAALLRYAYGKLTCTSFGPSYSRVNATCVNPKGFNLSCEMLRSGTAMRWAEYDPEGSLLACLPPGKT
ncbi:thermonuclease family protein [Sphingomonas quercus]|uniref:Thermonuclease family protein n=1 Tax=Sphingomonas quercus TaxID=2842451 RepID=A0ABS6BM01_9SPHN|nr:hypothetical protein [Sphingomonas quercus]MBU3079336.1 hypothetical protein [Sphingomonas quercus]